MKNPVRMLLRRLRLAWRVLWGRDKFDVVMDWHSSEQRDAWFGSTPLGSSSAEACRVQEVDPFPEEEWVVRIDVSGVAACSPVEAARAAVEQLLTPSSLPWAVEVAIDDDQDLSWGLGDDSYMVEVTLR